jgi:hypothetical protein
MGIIVGQKLHKNNLVEVAEKESDVLGAGWGFAVIMLAIMGLGIALMITKNKVVSWFVSVSNLCNQLCLERFPSWYTIYCLFSMRSLLNLGQKSVFS